MKKYLNSHGFTLIEMVIVLTVIAILVLLIIPNAQNIINSANETGCDALNSSNEALSIANELTGDNASIPQADLDRVCR